MDEPVNHSSVVDIVDQAPVSQSLKTQALPVPTKIPGVNPFAKKQGGPNDFGKAQSQ
jgi:hypothetical protein